VKHLKTYEGLFDFFKKKSEDDKLALDFLKRLQRIKGISPYKIEKDTEGTIEGEQYWTRYRIFFDDTIIKITKAQADAKYRHGWSIERQRGYIKNGDVKKNDHVFFALLAVYVGENIVCSPSIIEDFFDLTEEVYNRNIKLSRIKKIRDEMNPAADKLDPDIYGEPEEDPEL
jgi:hypothetical protein